MDVLGNGWGLSGRYCGSAMDASYLDGAEWKIQRFGHGCSGMRLEWMSVRFDLGCSGNGMGFEWTLFRS